LARVLKLILRLKEDVVGFVEPFLAPTVTGTIQLEWHSEGRSLELEAARDGWLVTGSEILTTQGRLYYTAECRPDEIAALARFHRWFQGLEPLWPSP
jgi:hypothetical protein